MRGLLFSRDSKVLRRGALLSEDSESRLNGSFDTARGMTANCDMSQPREIIPVDGPIHGSIRPPGSKSLTNRALITAALADGETSLSGVLDSRDTEVMIDSLGRLGIVVDHKRTIGTATVRGCAGHLPVTDAELWLENSGTSIRFLTAMCALGTGTYRLDGNPRMRQRPLGNLACALRELGVEIRCETGSECPPVELRSSGLSGGTTTVSGAISSQFLSALLMAAPCALSAVEIKFEGELVSRPYVDMTLDVMRAFGVEVDGQQAGRFLIEPQTYRAVEFAIEPDASAASYFLAAAAITGGTVTVEGLSRDSLQGDVKFADVLQRMGCRVDWGPDRVTVHGAALRGIDVDMNAISDTAQTLAAVAVFADGPTRIRNIAHVRHKETDRIAAVATQLRRLGVPVDEHDDGLTIHPVPPQPALIETYDDHRMAMSFALIGLKSPGIILADPDCTGKTYPRFFEDLDRLCGRTT